MATVTTQSPQGSQTALPPPVQQPPALDNAPRTEIRGLLGQLSHASGRFKGAAPALLLAPPALRWAFAGVAAMAFGAVVGTIYPVTHLCQLTIDFPHATEEATQNAIRAEWLLAATPMRAPTPGDAVAQPTWSVTLADGQHLTLSLRTPHPESGMERLNQAANAFQDRIHAKQKSIRRTPGPGEVVLANAAATLKQRRVELTQQLADAQSMQSDLAIHADESRLTGKWTSLRDDFEVLRSNLHRADETAGRIRAGPKPQRAIVSSRRRAAALEQDEALQQDLAELRIHLTNLKLQLLRVWQVSAGKLEECGISALRLIETADPESDLAFDRHSLAAMGGIRKHAQTYRELHAKLVDDVNREFSAIKQTQIDPLSGTLLDTHKRLRHLARDFLFLANRELATMRGLLQNLANDAPNHARYHVLESELTRGSERLQAQHDRLEFAMRGLEPLHNFRLDSALEGGRGLYRRTQARIAIIDDALRAHATDVLRKERERQLLRAEQSAKHLRATVDQRVQSLIDIQNALNLAHEDAQTLLRAVLLADMAQAQLALTDSDLSEIAARADALNAKRIATASQFQLTLSQATARVPAAATLRRAGAGSLAALLTFAAILLGQWWMRRHVFAATRQPR